jgi:hypothetical protein
MWAGIAMWLLMAGNEPRHVPLKFSSHQTESQGITRGQGKAASRVDLALLLANRPKSDSSFMAPKNIFRPLKTERESAAPSQSPKREASISRHNPVPPAPVFAPPATLPVPLPPPAATVPPVVAPLPPQGPTPEELAKKAGQQELSQYRYLGYLTRSGKDEAFLSKGNNLHIVKAGEVIDQRVLVKAIGPTGVTLQETASQVEHTVVLLP